MEDEKFKIVKELCYNSFLNDKNRGTEDICNFIKNNNYIRTLRDDDKEEIWIYKEGVYVPNGKTYITEIVRSIMGIAFTRHIKNTILDKIKSDTYIDPDIFFNNQNKYISIIPVQNGLLNIETKELLRFNPEMIFFNKLNVEFKPGLECPNIKQFFKDILESEEDFLTFQELFGFSMLKEYRFEKAFMLLGNGRNGKTKALDLLKRFLGIENCANLSLQEIEKDPFSLSELQNKLVNISGDISKAALENTGTFKGLTGRELIHAARKFKTRVKFENYCKMIFAANELPKTRDMTEAFFQRWDIINFPYTFYNTIDYEIHKHDKFAKVRDPDIIQKIATPDEMSGLLNWALLGLERLKRRKLFSCTKNSELIKETWIKKSDSATSFVKDNIIDNYNAFVLWSELKKRYRTYCSINNLKALNDKELRDSIIDNTTAHLERKYVDQKQFRVYEGITFKQEFQQDNSVILLDHISDNKNCSYTELKMLFPDDVVLDNCLKILSSEGKISEIRSGVWSVVK